MFNNELMGFPLHFGGCIQEVEMNREGFDIIDTAWKQVDNKCEASVVGKIVNVWIQVAYIAYIFFENVVYCPKRAIWKLD